ncbi:hypothetical protein, partial [Nocardia abscessus]|uniref:hypothetical protein n=1 Tax=Nocardia abscessus TaxID=120957 RepID=UPI003CC7E98F
MRSLATTFAPDSAAGVGALPDTAALSLPTAPKAVSAAEVDDLEEESPPDAQPVADASDITYAKYGTDSGV